MSRVFDHNVADYLSATSNSAYNVGGTGPWSIALWIKRTSVDDDAVEYLIDQNSENWSLSVNGGPSVNTIRFIGTSSISSIGKVNDTNWHHVAFTTDGSANFVFYIDGASAGSGALGLATIGQAGIWVGIRSNLTLPYDGKLGYVTVWSTQLSSANITTLQTSKTPETVGSGCVAAWHLDTSSLADSSSTNNPLAVTGTVPFDTDNPLDPSPANDLPSSQQLVGIGVMIGRRFR
jgi:hypothetical protein